MLDFSIVEHILIFQLYHLESLDELWCTLELQQSRKSSSLVYFDGT